MRLILLALLFTGCEQCGDWYNARGLARDLPKVVAPTGVTLTAIDCHWIPGIRTGYCLGNLTPQQIEQVRVGLKMAPADLTARQPDPNGCRSRPGFAAAPAFYRALTGTGFVYTSLHVGADGHFCMELEYGYG